MARHERRLSQLELAHRLGVSQRHVSFVECGRARPGRALLGRWLEVLDVPLAARNVVLTGAGYAPAYDDSPLGTPAVAVVTEAMQRLLEAHEPFPAVVLDADWDVVDSNRGFDWLISEVVGDADWRGTLNMLELMTGSGGLLDRMVNVEEAARAILPQLRYEAAVTPGLSRRLQAVLDSLEGVGLGAWPSDEPTPAFPVVPLRLATAHGELAFFTMFTTLGSPHNVTVASLRVEHLFPLDDHTRTVLAAEVGGAGRSPEARPAPAGAVARHDRG